MPDWLFEGILSLLFLVGVAAAICAYVWTKTRKRLWLGLTVTILAFLGVLVVLDRFNESDREQIVSNVQHMASAVPTRDFDAIFVHFAADFRYNAVNKAEFRRLCESIGKSRNVRDMVVWREQVLSFDETRKRADASFQFKLKADGLIEENFFLCKSKWVKESDGRWRMQSFIVYPLSSADQPLVIPGVG